MEQLIVIGSGPAGYTAAIYAARAGFEPLIVASSVTAGGALMTTTEVENFPGFPEGIQGPELMEKLAAQAARFGSKVLQDDAVKVQLSGPTKSVTTGDGSVYEAPAIILATGSAYRELGLDSEKALTGKGVSYCATCDGFFFRDKEIVVVGGGDTAMEEAIFLTRFASKVTVVHRRGELRASKIMAGRAMGHPKIDFAWHSEVSEVTGTPLVDGVRLRDTRSGKERHLPVDGVFVAIGHVPRSELFAQQVELDPQGYVVVHGSGAPGEMVRQTATSLPGVFACGDLVDHTYRQAITAAASGAQAAIDAQGYLTDLLVAQSESTTAASDALAQ
ncbi:MAG: thioredoxin-disulfide reductase [Micrococcales bacterium]|nr:thioredoxin-disulfide reductase [Micrococcales bacterium]